MIREFKELRKVDMDMIFEIKFLFSDGSTYTETKSPKILIINDSQ